MNSIAIFEASENPHIDLARCFRKHKVAKKLVAHKVAREISDRAIQLLDGFTLAGLGKLLINLSSIASFQSEAKYPKFVFDPNLAKLPGLRYPIFFAQKYA